MSEYIVSKDKIYNFLLAGRCECTIRNEESGNHFTYKIVKAKEQRDVSKTVYFLRVMYEYDSFRYAGLLIDHKDGKVEYLRGSKGHLNEESQSIRALLWVLNKAKAHRLPEVINVYHFGRCAHCGRVLEDPESILIGLGPVCRERVGVA